MKARAKHHWLVTLQRDDGNVSTRDVAAYWDPERDETPDAIGHAGRAEAFMASSKQHDHAVIKVALVEA